MVNKLWIFISFAVAFRGVQSFGNKTNSKDKPPQVLLSKETGTICGEEPGIFYKQSNDFFKRDAMIDFLKLDGLITTTTDCALNFVTGPLTAVTPDVLLTECACDCAYGHGGKGDVEVCDRLYLPISNDDGPISCTCTYLPEDIKAIDCQNQKSPEKTSKVIETRQEKHFDGLEKCASLMPLDSPEALMCRDEICNPVFTAVIVFSCSVVIDAMHKLEYNGYQLTKNDLCAIDCYTFHGATREPYGQCVLNINTKHEFCFCYLESLSYGYYNY